MADEENNKREIVTLNDLNLTDAEWDELLREVEAKRQTKRLRRDNPYVLDLIRVLYHRGNGMSRGMILHFVRKNRERLGLPMPRTFDDTVQQSCERFCIDSDVFKERKSPRSEALFCWPHGKGRGHWAIIRKNADAWLSEYLARRRRQKTKRKV